MKRKAPGTQAARCMICRVRPATAKDICTVCEGRMRRDAALGIRLEAFQPEEPQPRPKLVTTLLTLDDVDAMFTRGVNRQVLHQGARVIVESIMDPDTGLEVNRLTCVGDTWPEPPLAAVLRAEKEAT